MAKVTTSPATLNKWVVAAASANHIPPSLLRALIQQESGANQGAQSSAGAIGDTQLMPGTAKSLGVNPYDEQQNIFGGAKYLSQQLKRFGSVSLALAAYNAGPNAVAKYGGIPPYGETQAYVKNVMALESQYASLNQGASFGADAGGGVAPQPSVPQGVGQPGVTGGAPAPTGLAPGLQQAIALFQHPTGLGSQLQRIGGGAAAIGASLNNPIPLPTSLTQPVQPPQPMAHPDVPGSETSTMPPPADNAPAGWQKWVVLSDHADRSGVHTQDSVLEFAAKIGKLYGQPLTIGTGTNHNQFVVGTNRESQHWTGHAADIPSSGDALTRLGQTALIAAGMPHDEALKQKGGVFNIGRYQILFNTNVGGNHYNHLHIGVR